MDVKRCLDCTAIVAVGSRCPRCRATISAARASRRAPNGWEGNRRRERILERDMHMCRNCGGRATEVDHIVPVHQGGTGDDRNLVSLCESCHDKKTGRARQSQAGGYVNLYET